MKKKLVFVAIIAAIVLVFVPRVCYGMKMKEIKAEGRAVENADAVYDELGIDISMPEETDSSNFEYSIIDEKIGRVCFHHMGRGYYLQATREPVTLEEMGFIESGSWWSGTTLYAAGDDDRMTGIESVELEDGSSVVYWKWHGISFYLRSPEKRQELDDGLIEYIAEYSYCQPMIEQQTTEE